MKKKEWKKKYKELHEKYLLLEQRSLYFCYKCSWNAIVPTVGCLNCQHFDREEKKDQLGRTLPLEGHKEDCPHAETGWATCTCDYP